MVASHMLACNDPAVALRAKTGKPCAHLARRAAALAPVRASARDATSKREGCPSDTQLRAAGGALASAVLATLTAGQALADELVGSDVDVGSLFSDLASNPLALVGGAAAVAVPVVAAAVSGLGSGTKTKGTTPEKALEAMAEEPRVVLIDVRAKEEAKESGVPDLKDVKRKLVTLPLTQVVDEEVVEVDGWLEKADKTLKADAIPILICSEGKDAPQAAKALSAAREGAEVYFITGGADNWQASGAPWKEPSKGLSFPSVNLSSLKSLPSFDAKALEGGVESFAKDLKTSPDALKGALALGGLALGGALLVTEVEVLLQLVGVVAAGQFLATRLLFAKDRNQTLKEIKDLVDEKIVAGEAGEDLKKLASTVLEIKMREGTQGGTTKISAGAGASSSKVVAPVAASSSNGATAAPAPAAAAPAAGGPAEDAGLAARKASAQAWIGAFKARSSNSAALPTPPAVSLSPASDNAARKASARAWIDAWKERSKVTVSA